MKRKILNIFLLVLIVVLGIWLRTFNLSSRYSFGWDQQDDAVKVMGIISGKSLTLIGPRVAGPDSFFVPPWHYYFLSPFYLAGNGSPWSGEAATIFVGVVTIFIYYLTAKKLWGEKVGLLSAWGAGLAYSLVSWNVMYTPALTAIVFYLGNKMFEDKRYVLPAIVAAFFAGTTHLVPATLLVMVLLGIFLMKKRPKMRTVLIALLIGTVSLLPLLAFDIRHDFLNIRKVLEFAGKQGDSHGGLFNLLAWRAYFRGFSFMSGYKFSEIWYIGERLLLVGFVFLGIRAGKDTNRRIWYAIWFLFPAVILLFYHSNIPEYYFGIPIALVPIFIAMSTIKNKGVWAVIFLSLLTYVQIVRVTRERIFPALADKQAIVDFMIDYSDNSKFNFSYNVPFGDEVGYPYLFKWRGKEPQSTDDARLYTLIVLPEEKGERVIYKRGSLGIIRR
jgi:hypothetical protein